MAMSMASKKRKKGLCLTDAELPWQLNQASIFPLNQSGETLFQK